MYGAIDNLLKSIRKFKEEQKKIDDIYEELVFLCSLMKPGAHRDIIKGIIDRLED